MMVAQQLQEQYGRSLLAPSSDVNPALLLPNSIARAGLLLGFDSSGNVACVVPASGSAADLATNLADKSTASKGAGQVGFSLSLAYLTGSVGAALQARVPTVKDYPYSAKGDGSTDDTTVLQAAVAANPRLHFPPGSYMISGELVLSAFAYVTGAGRAIDLDLAAVPTSNFVGTRIVQTAAARAFRTTVTNGVRGAYDGHITIADLTVQGNNAGAAVGTYGLDLVGSQFVTLQRVAAYWFADAGIRIAAGVTNHLLDCETEYCADVGLLLDYAADYVPSSYNAYQTLITGGHHYQNANAGVKLATSTVGVKLHHVDIESTGNYYSSGNGYGLQMTDTARSVTVDHCWFEGNKNHIVASTTTSLSTVPTNLHVMDSQLWNSSGAKIVLLNGRNTIIENNEFLGGGVIQVKSNSGNPVLRNNTGNPSVQDSSFVEIPIDAADMTNNFPYSDLSNGTYWTLTNCSVAAVYAPSPAGPVPVYRVTPTAPGLVRLASIEAQYTWIKQRQTVGAFFKSDATAPVVAYIGLGSTGLSKPYMDSTVDAFAIRKTWAWQSVGRAIDAADIDVSASNQSFTIDITAGTTDPIYISGFVNLQGIVNLPYRYAPAAPASVTYSASMTFDAMTADEFVISPTDGTAFTINDPTSPALGMRKIIRIKNARGGGGTLGALTLGSSFKASAWVQPADTYNRSLTVEFNGTNWVEIARTEDVPN
jgi:hypothetical protein